MKEPKLAKCPFCNGKAELNYYSDVGYRNYFVFCKKCGAKSQEFYDPESNEGEGMLAAVEVWNRRYTKAGVTK